jgi:hypothetical protein
MHRLIASKTWRANTQNINWTQIQKRMLPIPQEQEIAFKFTHEHELLLKHANARWLRYWQSPGINSKRPYGDRTYFQWDMADILNIPYDLDSKGMAILSQKQLDYLNKAPPRHAASLANLSNSRAAKARQLHSKTSGLWGVATRRTYN